MNPRFERTARLVGEDGVARLDAASVMIVGLGGVGSYAFESVSRAGVGRLVLVDNDRVDITNLNRQLLALDSTLGRPKAEVALDRLRDINPEARGEARVLFVDEGNVAALLEGFDGWVIDAIDAVPSKVALVRQAVLRGLPVVSCMGA
ncbi:MAG TPA: ThiF family adenylyltransferase, partial [Candidatus Hydrogenedentes bacterium]|nr:ThiF family adenylyltransferase [Candidatus Hydrogenedentota bacterium]